MTSQWKRPWKIVKKDIYQKKVTNGSEFYFPPSKQGKPWEELPLFDLPILVSNYFDSPEIISLRSFPPYSLFVSLWLIN